MSVDPYEVLGIPHGSTEEEIRIAWRMRLRATHPDVGGSHEDAVRINRALESALELVQTKYEQKANQPGDRSSPRRLFRDVSSFTVDVLPVDCWHAIEIVAGQCGSVLVDEPPYLIEFTMHDSGLEYGSDIWCRCEMVPEAGATTVHVTVGSHRATVQPLIEVIRDLLVTSLNELDWSV